MKLNFLINYFCIMFSYLCYTGDLTHGNHTSASIKPLKILNHIFSQKVLTPEYTQMLRQAITETQATGYLSARDRTLIMRIYSERICLIIENIELTIKNIQLHDKETHLLQMKKELSDKSKTELSNECVCRSLPCTQIKVAKLIEQKNIWQELETIVKTEFRTSNAL